jgi:hypothetical protein
LVNTFDLLDVYELFQFNLLFAALGVRLGTFIRTLRMATISFAFSCSWSDFDFMIEFVSIWNVYLNMVNQTSNQTLQEYSIAGAIVLIC